MEDARADIERLAGMIADARRAVVFTGAGISTESGIPDFRSPTGIWSQTTPIYYQEFLASENARIEAWRRKLLVDRDIVDATPNRGAPSGRQAGPNRQGLKRDHPEHRQPAPGFGRA